MADIASRRRQASCWVARWGRLRGMFTGRCCAISQCFTFVSFFFFFLTTMYSPEIYLGFLLLLGSQRRQKHYRQPQNHRCSLLWVCIETFPSKGALTRHYQANPMHDVRPTTAWPYQCESCERTSPHQEILANTPSAFILPGPAPTRRRSRTSLCPLRPRHCR